MLEMPLNVYVVACSRGINALSDGAVYSLTHSSPWNANQNAADSIAQSGFGGKGIWLLGPFLAYAVQWQSVGGCAASSW